MNSHRMDCIAEETRPDGWTVAILVDVWTCDGVETVGEHSIFVSYRGAVYATAFLRSVDGARLCALIDEAKAERVRHTTRNTARIERLAALRENIAAEVAALRENIAVEVAALTDATLALLTAVDNADALEDAS